MKGIILAGGSGSRLHPMTSVVSKQLLPVGGKPMIYYILSTMMLAKIREVLIISTPRDLPLYEELLGDGTQIGMTLKYAVQPEPRGLAQAFTIAHEVRFADGSPLCLGLGDNIYYGSGLTGLLTAATSITTGAHIFGYEVDDPKRFGVMELNDDGVVIGIEEKPEVPKTNLAIPGFYTYGPEVVGHALALQPSARGEYEITDLNMVFLEAGTLTGTVLPLGIAWVDTGTDKALALANSFIHVTQQVRGLWIACIEEIALRNGWINRASVAKVAETMPSSAYGEYLMKVANRKDWPLRTT